MLENNLKILGCKAEDIATGVKGTIVSVSFDASGCIMGLISTPAKDGEYKTAWFDVKRLKVGKRILPEPFFSTPARAPGPEMKRPATPGA